MKILICDDDIYFAQCIYKFLQQIESEQNLLLEIQSFNNTEALLDVVKTDSEIKLIFLDIIFTGSKVNGIKIAKEIEKINYKVKIVFITSYDSFAIQGYQMNTVGYLMKPIEYNVFKEKFKTYLAQLDYEEKYLCIKTECNYVMIKYSELMYIDTLGRTVGVHTINQVYRVRHTMRELAENAGVEILKTEVKKVELTGVEKRIYTEKECYCAKKVILANGTSPRKLGIPGEIELAGRGIGMNAAKDAMKYRGKHVYVIGGADGAVKEALYLAGVAEKVTIIHFEETLGCIAQFQEKVAHTPNIELRLHARLHAVYGVEKVESLEILDEKTGAIEIIEDSGCGIFVYAGTVPNTELYNEIRLDNGFLPTDENMQTEIPGVYAVGDIRVKQVRQVSTAVADGTIAAIHAAR